MTEEINAEEKGFWDSPLESVQIIQPKDVFCAPEMRSCADIFRMV